MRKSSKGFNSNLVSYLCKFSGVFYTIAIVSSCNNGNKYLNINEKQYRKGSKDRKESNSSNGGNSINRTLLPKKSPKYKNDELTEEKENNNEKHLNINEKQYSSSTEIYNNNDKRRKDDSSDKETLKTKKNPNRNFVEQEVRNDYNNYNESAVICNKDDDEKSNCSDSDQGQCTFSFDEIQGMLPTEDEEPYKDFSKMQSVCPNCGILLDYGETGYHHRGLPEDHKLIFIKDAANYVYDDDLKVFMGHLDLYKIFIKQQKFILKQKKKRSKDASDIYSDIRKNALAYYLSDQKLICKLYDSVFDDYRYGGKSIEDVTKLYNDIGKCPDLPKPSFFFTKTLIENLERLIVDMKGRKERGRRVGFIFSDELRRLFYNPIKQLDQEFEDITGCFVHKDWESDRYITEPVGEKKILVSERIDRNLREINQFIDNYKQQLKYIKTAKKLKERFDENPNDLLDDKQPEGPTIKTILKAFAFTILKYTSQLKEIEISDSLKNYATLIRQKKSLEELSLLKNSLDSKGNYQMFYGARYLDNVEMAMIWGLYSRKSDGKDDEGHIPVSISKAFDSKINFLFHDSETIGGSADGYVAIFDLYRAERSLFTDEVKSRNLYIFNILTGESVTVRDVKQCRTQPVFWENKLLLFSAWDDSMLMFDRDEFMKNPNISLGRKIQKERLFNLPDSFETHHTGKLFFSDNYTIKEFDIKSEKVIKEIETESSFSPVPIFGKEKLDEPESVPEIQEKDLDFMYLSTTRGLFKQNPSGEYEEILKTDGTVASMILSNKHPEDYSKALIFCWSKIYYGNKSSRRLCGIPVRSNMLMRLYSDVYYIMNSNAHKWECRRIFFDEDFEDQKDHQ